MDVENWDLKVLEDSTALNLGNEIQELSTTLINMSHERADDLKDFGLNLAASFDLIVSLTYYASVKSTGWCYCPEGESSLIFSYVNLCPKCLFKGEFHHLKGGKPPSGVIGKKTREVLAAFWSGLFKHRGKKIEFRLAKEPVDLVAIDELTKTILVAEVKSAPLCCLPIFSETEKLQDQGIEDSDDIVEHISIGRAGSSPVYILMPIRSGSDWSTKKYLISEKFPFSEKDGFLGVMKLLNDDQFFKEYIDFWKQAYSDYSNKNRDSTVFWLTNACGAPSPAPENWPTRSTGKGKETISDAKTSAGMDRTDDIKKGIYQVLKLGTEGKPKSSNYEVKTALISNMDAARHHDEYLSVLENVMWTTSLDGSIKYTGDLEPQTPIYNLFDGIITFSKNLVRDEWVKEVFDLEGYYDK